MHLEAVSEGPRERDSLNAVNKALSDFRQYRDIVISNIQAGKMDEALDLLSSPEAERAAENTRNAMINLVMLKEEMAKHSYESNISSANTATITMIIVIIIGVIVAIVLGLFISRSVSKPINNMLGAANKLAVGDISVNIKANTKDEIGSLAEAFSRMIANVREQALAVEKLA